MSLFKHSLVRLLCLFMIVAAVTARPGKSKHVSTRHKLDHRPVGRDPVTSKNFSFLASVRALPKELHRCGGFLISRVHVMTTASCTYSARVDELHVYMNPLRLDNLGTYIGVKDIRTHPNFTLTPHEHDLAILTLEKGYDAEFPVIPDWVDLPSKSPVLSFSWGYDKIPGGVGNVTLHMYQLQIMENGLCSLVLREYLSCDTLCGTSLSQFATGNGDVGTPLIYIGEGKMYAVGMLVKGTEEMVNAAPYMRLRQFLNWIKETTASLSTTLSPGTTAIPEESTPEETTTTTVVTEPPPPETTTIDDDDYALLPQDYQEQPVKRRARKRAAFQRQMFRDASMIGNRQITRFG